MTALKTYERLECTGLWRSDAAAQRREVVVSFGQSSLVLSDMQSRPLTHWSLSAIKPQNPGQIPLILHPGPDSEEQLELSDPDMIEALIQVQHAIAKSRPRPGRLRLILGGVGLVALITFGTLWLPQAIRSYAANIIPDVKQEQLGDLILNSIAENGHPICSNPYGVEAANQLAARLDPDGVLSLTVVQGRSNHPLVLPGDTVVIFEDMLRGTDDPAVISGHILSGQIARFQQDPMLDLLNDASVLSAVKLIASNQPSTAQVDAFAQSALQGTAADIDVDALIAAFETAKVSATPFASHAQSSLISAKVHELLLSDPYPAGSPQPLLPDGAWLGLQSICDEP